MRFMNIETDPRAKIVQGIRNRDEATLFDAWIHDGRRHGYGTHNHVHLGDRNSLRFFSVGARDPRRCSQITPGYFAADQAYRITHLGLHINFSSRDIETEFMRSSVCRLWVGDRPMYYLHGHLLAQPAPFVERLETDDPAESGLRLWVDFKEAPIAIPPRQPFYIDVEMMPSLYNMLKELPLRRRAFGMVKVMMKGQLTRAVFEDELTDKDRATLAKRHEEMMRKLEEEQEAAAKSHDEDEQKSYEDYAFFMNVVCPAGTDVKPEHVAEVFKIQHAIDSAIYAIGGGGHRGGVPPFDSLEFGFVDELVIGKRERGFDDRKPRPKYQWSDLRDAAGRIARERVLNKKPLDEEYRQEVAAAIGIDDYKSAVPEMIGGPFA